ncbi:MAG: glycerophosphodiester phosphodiesterase [Clostridia bacterium]|nr:glycerophosphodiester phosphodiesterase [Clostridia bacterium]
MKILVEGHRGYCAKYPENTLISYEAAIDLGVDCFEFDVWLSKDKVPILMHDGNARRTCGVYKNLRDMTLEEIKTLEAAYTEKFGDEFVGKGIEVPTLEELCKLVSTKRPHMPLGVEIKEYTEETVDITVEMLKSYGLFDNAWFYAFDAPTIKYLKTKYNARTMGYPDFQMKRFDPSEGYRYYDEIGLSMRIVNSEVFPIFAAKGLPMHMYCADTEEEVRICIEKGASLITANDPVPLMRVVKED